MASVCSKCAVCPSASAMVRRRKRLDVNRLSHSDIAGVVWMEIIPWQLCERAVRQILRLHIACRRVERRRVKILHSVVKSGSANEGIEDHSARIVPRTVVAHVDAADTERRGQRCAEHLDALGM